MAKPRSFSFRRRPRRVQILTSHGGYFKRGQYGYVMAMTTHGGMHLQDTDGTSSAGERSYLISKTKEMRGGALWYSRDALRFTKRRR